MAESDPAPRRFSDEEVRAILARAAKLQELAPPAPSVADGLSLRDLEQVGEEAGIDGALVRRAQKLGEARTRRVDQAGRRAA